VITTLGRSSVNPAYLLNNEVYNRYLKDRRLVLVDDLWCQKDKEGLCGEIKKKFTLEKIETKHSADSGLFYYLSIKK
jgi:hypothetical protein